MSDRTHLLADEPAEPSGSIDAARAHPLSNWLSAVRAGYLPTNDQLFVALHKLAAQLDGFASSVGGLSRSKPAKPKGGAKVATEDAAVDEPLKASAALFEESAGLLRDTARWFNDTDIEQEVQADATDSKDKTRKIQVPSGNSRQQIQRLVYHARNARISADAGEHGWHVFCQLNGVWLNAAS